MAFDKKKVFVTEKKPWSKPDPDSPTAWIRIRNNGYSTWTAARSCSMTDWTSVLRTQSNSRCNDSISSDVTSAIFFVSLCLQNWQIDLFFHEIWSVLGPRIRDSAWFLSCNASVSTQLLHRSTGSEHASQCHLVDNLVLAVPVCVLRICRKNIFLKATVLSSFTKDPQTPPLMILV